MSPTTLPRMQGVRAAGERDHHPHHDHDHVHRTRERHQGTAARASEALAMLATPLVPLLTAPQARHWLVEIGATLCVAGGFIAAPVLTLAAWIGLALPPRMPLHQASTPLFLVAIIWMAAALIGAHLHHDRRARRLDWRDAEGE